MLAPDSQTVYKLDFFEVRSLCDEYLPDLNLDTNIFTREGCHHYLVNVTDEIVEYNEWLTEKGGLMDNPERCSVSEALADYLSIIAWRKGIPAGCYLVAIFW